MHRITQSKDRKLEITEDNGAVIISERTAWLPPGYNNRHWTEVRVWLTHEELQQIAEMYRPPANPAGSANPSTSLVQDQPTKKSED